MKEKLSEIKGALLTGVSYMLPFVIAGGILIALGFAIGGYDIPNSVEEYGNFASTIFWLGKKAFALMVPVLVPMSLIPLRISRVLRSVWSVVRLRICRDPVFWVL